MSHQPNSCSVSRDGNRLTYRSTCAEPSCLNPNCEVTFPGTLTFGETGVEKMTPFEFEQLNHRMWHVAKINFVLRDLCFRRGIADQLPEDAIAQMDKSFEVLYAPFHLDQQIFERGLGHPNKALRWRLMGQIWRLLCAHIFDQLNITDKDPEADPVLVNMRDAAAAEIKRFLEPFRVTGSTETNEMDSKIDEMVGMAKALFHMLHHDNAKYLFFFLMDQSSGGPLLLYSQFTDIAEPVEICGAPHRDASWDRIGITAAAGLMIIVGDCRTCLKRAGVVLHRPPSSGST
jgi:hypothetical protein